MKEWRFAARTAGRLSPRPSFARAGPDSAELLLVHGLRISPLARNESLDDIARFLAQTPIMPLDGSRPIELARGLFERP